MSTKLKDALRDATERRQKESAAQLMNTVTDLKLQYQNVKTTIAELKAKIKPKVANDNWVGDDIIKLGEEITLYNGVRQKMGNYKTQLSAMRDLIPDVDCKTELQDEINALVI